MVDAELYHQMIHVGNAIGSTQRIEEFQLGLWWLHVIGIVRWFWCWKMFKTVIFSVQTYHKGFGCVFWWVKRGKAKVGPLKNSGDQTWCAGKAITQFDDVPVLKTSMYNGLSVYVSICSHVFCSYESSMWVEFWDVPTTISAGYLGCFLLCTWGSQEGWAARPGEDGFDMSSSYHEYMGDVIRMSQNDSKWGTPNPSESELLPQWILNIL